MKNLDFIYFLYFLSSLLIHYISSMSKVLWDMVRITNVQYRFFYTILMPKWASVLNISNIIFKIFLLGYIGLVLNKSDTAIGLLVVDLLILAIIPKFPSSIYYDLFFENIQRFKFIDPKAGNMLEDLLNKIIYK